MNIIAMLHTHKYIIDESVYLETFSPPARRTEFEMEYTRYKNIFYPGRNKPSQCQIIGPYLEVLEPVLPESYETSYKENLNLIKTSNGQIGIASIDNVYIGDLINPINILRLPNEEFFTNFGIVPEKNLFDHAMANYILYKNRLSLEQVNFCEKTGCGGFNMLAFYHENFEDEILTPFPITTDNINTDVINTLRILHMKNPSDDLLPLFKNFSPVSYNVDIKALAEYIKTMMANSRVFEYQNLIGDYEQIARIKNNIQDRNTKVTNLKEEIKSLFYYTKELEQEDDMEEEEETTSQEEDKDVHMIQSVEVEDLQTFEDMLKIVINKIYLFDYNVNLAIENIDTQVVLDIRKLKSNYI